MPGPSPADRIPAKTDAQAKIRYLRFLQQSLSAVHANAIWRVLPTGQDRWTAFTVPETLALKRQDGSRLYLRATQRFMYGDHPEFKKERKVVTLGYAYTLSDDESLRPEWFSWQWQSDAAEPHLHVGRGDPKFGSLGKLHVPTGRVAFEHILLFAIEEQGVVCAIGREAAVDQVKDCLRRFVAFRTWH